MHRGAAERGGDQERPVGAGAVGDGVRQHEVEQLVRGDGAGGGSGAGAVDHLAQEGALGVLVEVVDEHAVDGGQGGDRPGVPGARRGVGGVQHQQVHPDVEPLDGVGGFGADGGDGVRALAVGGQGQADVTHSRSPGR